MELKIGDRVIFKEHAWCINHSNVGREGIVDYVYKLATENIASIITEENDYCLVPEPLWDDHLELINVIKK